MKYSLLIFALFFSQLSFAYDVSQKTNKVFATDEGCEIKASFIKFENSPIIFLEIHDLEQVVIRRLTLELMNTGREVFRTDDDKLPGLEVRMTFEYENSLPLLSVYYSGRYLRCSMNHIYEE